MRCTFSHVRHMEWTSSVSRPHCGPWCMGTVTNLTLLGMKLSLRICLYNGHSLCTLAIIWGDTFLQVGFLSLRAGIFLELSDRSCLTLLQKGRTYFFTPHSFLGGGESYCFLTPSSQSGNYNRDQTRMFLEYDTTRSLRFKSPHNFLFN